MAYELVCRKLTVERQVPLPIQYRGVALDVAYRVDLLVEHRVVVEIKAVDRIAPIHVAQLLSYLKLGRHKLGLVLNFNTPHMRHGIRRVVNGLSTY